MTIQRHPTFKDKVVVSTWNGSNVMLDCTPVWESALAQIELQAGMSTARPLRDNATLNDFQAAHPGEGLGPLFYRWLTLNQCDARKAVQLELEARGQDIEVSASGPQQQKAMTFHPTMKSHTYHPGGQTMGHTFHPSVMGDATEADPLKRQATPLANPEDDFDEDDSAYDDALDGDVDHLRLPSAASLRTLQRAGLIKRSMTEEQFGVAAASAGKFTVVGMLKK